MAGWQENGMADETGAYGSRLRDLEQRLGTIERVLFALARTQGIDPETAD